MMLFCVECRCSSPLFFSLCGVTVMRLSLSFSLFLSLSIYVYLSVYLSIYVCLSTYMYSPPLSSFSFVQGS